MSQDRPPLDPHPLSPYVAWAGHRNRDPILEMLKTLFPKEEAHVLEFASGSGMHLHYFAPHFDHLHFHPSDMNEEVFPNIEKLTAESGLGNIRKPRRLDLTQPETWPNPDEEEFHAIYCINIFQVAPVSIADGMMQCASQVLADDGFLFIYGPFKIDGKFTTPSNEEFDRTLRSAGVPEWGLKDTADLNRAAAKHGMRLDKAADMPANNFALIYRRA
jgi:cyclopropane fatty-acyl-phospholipid synthase-like methyltransferase